MPKEAKIIIINKLAKLGWHSTGESHYRKSSGWMTNAKGERVYVNFRDFLEELTKPK